jgi:hypothetical protein
MLGGIVVVARALGGGLGGSGLNSFCLAAVSDGLLSCIL